MVLSTWTT